MPPRNAPSARIPTLTASIPASTTTQTALCLPLHPQSTSTPTGREESATLAPLAAIAAWTEIHATSASPTPTGTARPRLAGHALKSSERTAQGAMQVSAQASASSMSLNFWESAGTLPL